MTVCGFLVSGNDRAWAWSDSEAYLATDPVGAVCKMSMNALGGFVGIGTGARQMLIDAGTEMQGMTSIDAAMILLPATILRKFKSGGFGVAGWSYKLNRIVGCRFDAARGYEAQMVSRACWPHVDLEGLDPFDHYDFIEIAIAQMRLMRASNRRATGLHLVVAELGPETVKTRRVANFGKLIEFDAAALAAAPKELSGVGDMPAPPVDPEDVEEHRVAAGAP